MNPLTLAQQKRLVLALVVLVILTAVAIACTDNYRAKNMGGTMTVQLPAGQKLDNATWKDNHLWYLTRPMRSSEGPETWTFREKSESGIWQGTVVFQESK